MGIKRLLILAILFLWASSLQAATQLYSENFDDQVLTCTQIYITVEVH